MNLRPVISPEMDFHYFCGTLLDSDPLAVVDAASAEIARTRGNHRMLTRQKDFREGSRGRIYCDNLKALLSIFMRGQMPENPNADFVSGVSPLMRCLLMRWKIGHLDILAFQDQP
ncbi:MAG: hypothetical protein WCK77_18695 [Verrucomicrobiota bacterium]